MYIKKLIISEGSNKQKIIQDISFKKGFNIIVDESSLANSKSTGNNVGKTTVLKIIDICFGAQDRKYIWTDNDTNSVNIDLKNYIKNNKVYAELTFEKSSVKYHLKIELFERGKRYINGVFKNYPDYLKELNQIVFGIEKPPTFRQLIKKFVRIKQTEDVNTFLKFLDKNTSDAEYKNIYNFLFSLSSNEDSEKELILTKKINQLDNDKKKLIEFHNIANINDLEERTRIVKRTVQELEKQLEALISIKDYQDNLNDMIELKNHLNNLNDKIELYNFKILKIERLLLRESNHQDEIDIELLNEFYREVEESIGKLIIDFEELINFNDSIRQNKIQYYNTRLIDLKVKLEHITHERDSIINTNQDLLKVINESNFERFEKVHKELIEQSQRLGILSNVKEIYSGILEDLQTNQEDLKKLKKSSIDKDKHLSSFNEYFTSMSSKVLEQRLYISPNEPFPLKLSNVDDGVGTGYRKTITLLFDIAYVSFIKEMKLEFPKFFVHDVLETIDEDNFYKIYEFIKSNDSQFIFAVLNEKIQQYDFIDDNDIRLKLSRDNRLFKI
ncbi:hypothetical protein M3591_09580 [Exiguobacterium sp. MER 193]|uniref:hypothetical protein n=1 Tax=Exiguobacterium sp. MER 193 TaxID=2939564 RepID=UPI00203FBEAA|nr:hypothetical protein [Exiguobacterium sp. MER 193]MCM3280783.1 hypothetical protein [Exiguobacterium sp. MER 193]